MVGKVFGKVYTLAGFGLFAYLTLIQVNTILIYTQDTPLDLNFYHGLLLELSFNTFDYQTSLFLTKGMSYINPDSWIVFIPLTLALFTIPAFIFYFIWRRKERVPLKKSRRFVLSFCSVINTMFTITILFLFVKSVGVGLIIGWGVGLSILAFIGYLLSIPDKIHAQNRQAQRHQNDITAKTYGDADPMDHAFMVQHFCFPAHELLSGQHSHELILGKTILSDGRQDIIKFGGKGHLLTFAPTGGGKGVATIMPNVLNYRGSAFIIDPKGEVASVSGRRRTELNNKVHYLDPFKIVRQRDKNGDFSPLPDTQFDSFNPFDILDKKSETIISDAKTLSNSLIVRSANSKDPFWDNMAEEILRGIILYVACHLPAEHRNLHTVYKYLYSSQERFLKLIILMQKSKLAHGVIANIANGFEQTPEKTKGSILATVRQNLEFLSDPAMQRVLKTSTFSFDELKTDTTTIYLCLPPHKIEEYKRWLRLMIATGIKRMQIVKSPTPDSLDVLFLLDEFASLGYMKEIEDAFAIIRGDGVKIWAIMQDLNQIKETYDKWESLISNSGAVQFFKPSDLTTAEYISNLMGEKGYWNETTSISQSESIKIHNSSSTGVTFYSKPLMSPDKLMRTYGEREYVFLTGERFLELHLLKYYDEDSFKDKNGVPIYEDNPYLS